MPLVVGLGNPGGRYQGTRHNVGRAVLEVLVHRWGAVPGSRAPEYRAWRAEVGEQVVDLVTPETYMNLSGMALAAWNERHGLDPAGLLVVTDDVYLPVGALRLRADGSSGGHRGLESIEEALESREYARLRIGVGAAGDSARLREHVLEDFSGEERPVIEETLGLAADAVECWVAEGTIAAMNRFNRKVRKEEPES